MLLFSLQHIFMLIKKYIFSLICNLVLEFKNVNAEQVKKTEQEQREKSKMEAEKKREKDKQDREAQKEKQKERKEAEKKRTQKGERRRWWIGSD